MLYNVVAEIEIDGNGIDNYYSLQIRQHFNEHHEFKVKLPYDVLDAKDQFALSKVKNFLGKVILIRLQSGDKKQVKNEFKGIITQVSIEQYDAYKSQIVVAGFSPTIILEGGPHINCYIKKNLKKIIEEASADALSECSLKVATSNTKEILYLTQYNESNYQFINRLSAEYGEWFFYDGKNLNFGKPSNSKEIEIVVGEDVAGIELKLQLLPLNSSSVSYSLKDNKVLKSKTPSSAEGLGEYGKFASTESGKIFSTVASTGIRPKADVQDDLANALTVKKTAAASQLEVVSGTSVNPELSIGSTASIAISLRIDGGFSKQDHGKFLIVGVTHEISEDGKYSNSFEGLPASVKIIPVKNVTRPVAETQVAVVTDNKDPDKIGRVKVKMLWQETSTTDWIRVSTPDAGTGGKTGKNRGFVFIPEVNDEVLVGFNYNDPDWPFVLGSVFHGKSGQGGGNNNSVKTLGTVSGHTITFDDEKKSLLIEDAKGNKINFDGNGKIIMESSDAIELKCGQSSLSLAKDGSIKLKGGKVEAEGTTEIGLKAPNVSAKADANLKLEGAMVSAKGSATISVEGAMAKLAGSGMTEISGGIVKIN